ncbi:MAG: hypothetical protein AAFR22_23920, partial [Chloroflexota bacterium]
GRRLLLTLGLVFVVLVGILLLQIGGVPQFGAQPTPDPFGDIQRVLTDFTVVDIQAVRIGSPNTGEEFLITRSSDGTWTAPDVAGTLDAEVATAIARTMVILPYSGTVPLQEDTELAQFGFVVQNPRAVSVEILLVDGSTHALFFGGLTPLQDAFYAIVDEREQLYLVDPRAVEFLRLQLRNPPVNLTTE